MPIELLALYVMVTSSPVKAVVLMIGYGSEEVSIDTVLIQLFERVAAVIVPLVAGKFILYIAII
jgi:hypothetical protein